MCEYEYGLRGGRYALVRMRVCVCVCVCVPLCLHLCVCSPSAFSQLSRTSLIQLEWKSFLHGEHRRQKEMEEDVWMGGGGGATMNPQISLFSFKENHSIIKS